MKINNPTITDFEVPVKIFNKWIAAEKLDKESGKKVINNDDMAVLRLIALMNTDNVCYYLSHNTDHRVCGIYNTLRSSYSYIDPDNCIDFIDEFVDKWGLRRFSATWKVFSVQELHKIPPYLAGMYICLDLGGMNNDASDVIYVGVHPHCILSRHTQHHIHGTPCMWNIDTEHRGSESLPCECGILVPLEWNTMLNLSDVENFYIDVMIPIMNRTRISKQILNLFKTVSSDDYEAAVVIEEYMTKHIQGYKNNIDTMLDDLFKGQTEITFMLPLDVNIKSLNTDSSRRTYIQRLLEYDASVSTNGNCCED